MKPLLTEVHAMQNPGLGAALVWRFACGYCPETQPGDGTPFPLAFVILPVVLHTRTRENVTSTRVASGARKFEEKFKERGDLLFALNDRAISMRHLSLRSMRIAMACGLITILPERAAFWPRSYTSPANIRNEIGELMKAAEKLGSWCASSSSFARNWATSTSATGRTPSKEAVKSNHLPRDVLRVILMEERREVCRNSRSSSDTETPRFGNH